MLQLMKWFGWTWAGLLFIDNDWGHDAARLFQSDLSRSALGCLAYQEALPWDHDQLVGFMMVLLNSAVAR